MLKKFNILWYEVKVLSDKKIYVYHYILYEITNNSSQNLKSTDNP